MKIKTEYDIIKKIRHSKDGMSAIDIFKKFLLKTKIMHAFAAISFLLCTTLPSAIDQIFFILIKCGSYGLGYYMVYLASKLYSKAYKEESIKEAEIDLQKLVNELSKIEVKTSVELLQEAKINQAEYKIEYKDGDKIPRLRHYKYIDVPLCNGYEETILQEHTYFDKDYEISVNSPVKKMAYKPAKANI